MKIAVFCGAHPGNDPVFAEAAREVGNWIGHMGYSLIYGGGETGLMGEVAKAVHAAGCEIIGVVPQNVDFIINRDEPYVTRLVAAENMASRKQTMMDLADVFIALPGGIGTLDEISEAITLTKIGVFKKPCILYDKNHYYATLKTLLDQMVRADFMKEEDLKEVLFSEDLEEIGSFIKS